MYVTASQATVSAIVDDLTAGLALPWAEACFKFNRSVHALRIAAANTESVISDEQRQELDTAIRNAQPAIVGNPVSPDLRIMVCALHIVVGEWANPSRSESSGQTPNVLEAFILARMLDNNLDNANLKNVLQRQRGEMAPEQWRWLGAVTSKLYPMPIPTVEPMPFVEQTVH